MRKVWFIIPMLILLSSFVSAKTCTTCNESIVDYWTFDVNYSNENGNMTFSAQGNAQINTSDSIVGNSASFDGTGDYLNYVSDYRSLYRTPLTVQYWIKTFNEIAGEKYLSMHGGGSDQCDFPAYKVTGSEMFLYHAGGIVINNQFGPQIPKGEWIMETWVVNATHWALYRNGTLVETLADANGMDLYNDDPNMNFCIFDYCDGGGGTNPNYNPKGNIDELTIWSKALSSTEVADSFTDWNDGIRPIDAPAAAPTAPTITTPEFNNTSPNMYQDVTGNTTYSDLNSDLGTVYFRWYVNGDNLYNDTRSSVATGTTLTSIITNTNYSTNDIVNVTVYASDGGLDSSIKSAQLTVQNVVPSITLINPVNDSITSNTAITFNYTVSDFEGANLNATAYLTNGTMLNQTLNIASGSNINYIINFPSTTVTYNWFVEVTDGDTISNTSYVFLVDTTSPIINLLGNNTFKSDNSTIVSSYLIDTVTIAINFSDPNLFAFFVNVTNSSGFVLWNYTVTSITTQDYSISHTLNISSYPLSDVIIHLESSDSHTSKQIKSYGYVEEKERLLYETTEGNIIGIEYIPDENWIQQFFYSNVEDLYTTKQKDRYNFDFKFKEKRDWYRFKVTSDHKIVYVPDSDYNGHFIVYSDGLNGNWVDFNEKDLGKGNYVVEKISDYEYIVTVSDTNKKHFSFNSIGGLNFNQVDYKFEVGAVLEVYARDTRTDTLIPFDINVSGSFYNVTTNGLIIQNVTGGTKDIKLTKLNYITYIEQRNITLNYYNITYNLTTQSILDDCSGFNISTLNVSFIEYGSEVPFGLDYTYIIDYTYNGTAQNLYKETTGSNFSICIDLNTTALDVDVFVEYINDSHLYTYYLNDITLSSDSEREIILRVIGSTTDIDVVVYNNQNEKIEDVYITYQKFDSLTNTYLLNGIAKTNFEGATVIPLRKTLEFYRFYLYYPYGTLKQSTSPTYIFEDSLVFQLDTITPVGESFYQEQDVDYSLLYNEGTENFKFQYNDPNALVTQGCLNIYQLYPTRRTLINSTCVSSVSSTILINKVIDNGTTIQADAVVTMSGNEIILGSISESREGDAETNEMGLFIILIMLLLFAFVIRYSLELTVIITPLPLLFGSLMNLVDLSVPVAASIEIGAIVLAIILNKVID